MQQNKFQTENTKQFVQIVEEDQIRAFT